MLQVALAKNFYACKMTADEIRLAQQLFVYDRASFKCIEVAHVHNRVTLVKCRIVESAFWQSPNQRHLPAFESKPDTSAGARLLALGPLAAAFSMSRTLAAPEAFYTMAGAGTRSQIMKVQHVAHPSRHAMEFRAV
jgi:hypothetical protein